MENGARTRAEVPKMGELTYTPQPPGVTRRSPGIASCFTHSE